MKCISESPIEAFCVGHWNGVVGVNASSTVTFKAGYVNWKRLS